MRLISWNEWQSDQKITIKFCFWICSLNRSLFKFFSVIFIDSSLDVACGLTSSTFQKNMNFLADFRIYPVRRFFNFSFIHSLISSAG